MDDELRRRVRHVFTENDRVSRAVAQLEAGDSAGLGETFVASHASMRDDYEISCPELDVVVESATSHGALGARMTGGGFGGSAIALVANRRHRVRGGGRAGGVRRARLALPRLPHSASRATERAESDDPHPLD